MRKINIKTNEWHKMISGDIISFYKDNLEVRILYDYSLFRWKVILLKDDKFKERIARTTIGGIKGKTQAVKYAKAYMKKH